MARFTEDFIRMRNDSDRGHEDRERLNREIHDGVRDMAENVKAMLNQFGGQMCAAREQLRDTAHHLKMELGEFTADLRTGGKIFRKERSNR